VGLLVAGCVGAGIGASLADMRVTEQIDAIEAFSIDSFKLFVVPRIIACVVSLPILTVFIDGNHSQGRSEFTDKLLEAAKTRSPLSLIEHLETVRFHFRGYSGSPVSAFNADRITCFARVMLLIIVVVVFPFFAITCTTRLS
jgi:hypothetical protein